MHFRNAFDQQQIESAWRLSQGTSALLQALLENAAEHPLKRAIDEVKSFLRARRYERWLIIEETSKNKEEFRIFIEALAKVLAALHQSVLQKGKPGQVKKLLHDRKLAYKTLNDLDANANTRLVGLNLLLNLKT